MSRSLTRVIATLKAAGIDPEIGETPLARTAADAAAANGCDVNAIAKSIIFRGERGGAALLFLTAGGNRVDGDLAAALAGEPLGKADAALVRAQTGFAIGGVAPVGHLTPIRAWLDRGLTAFETVWAAAGTPHHVFAIPPPRLLQITQAQLSDFTRDSKKM